MSYPFEDSGFTLWHSDLDTHLMRSHGVTSQQLGVDRRQLQDRYYGGDSVHVALDKIVRRHIQGRI